MMLVIETNLSMNNDGQVLDHQSRVVQVESWSSYIEEFENKIYQSRKSFLGDMDGYSIPCKCLKIENLKTDDKHLSCDILIANANPLKKLAYLILQTD